MTSSKLVGQLGGFVVEQPVFAGVCVVVHAPAEQATRVSQETSGSLPYSQVTLPVHVSPELGTEDGQTLLEPASEDPPSGIPSDLEEPASRGKDGCSAAVPPQAPAMTRRRVEAARICRTGYHEESLMPHDAHSPDVINFTVPYGVPPPFDAGEQADAGVDVTDAGERPDVLCCPPYGGPAR
jgi:hypothetical protein